MISAYLELISAYRDSRNTYSPEDRRMWKIARLREKDGRMHRRLARHRGQIWKRNWMLVWLIVFWLCAPAIGIATVAAVWRICAWVVFS